MELFCGASPNKFVVCPIKYFYIKMIIINYIIIKSKKKKINFIQLKNQYIYEIDINDQCEEGYIGLSKFQRETLHIDKGEKIKINRINISDQIPYISSLTLKISLLRNKRTTLIESDVYDKLLTKLNENVINISQKIGIRQNEIPLLFEVKHLKIQQEEDESDEQKATTAAATYGVIGTNLLINFEYDKSNPLLMFIESVERHKQIIKSDWSFESMGIGGLDDEFGAILRRAFASRIYSKDVLKSFGIRHVKGILLYGPPGTGKTLIARQISKMIDNNGPEPIKVNGPEILNKYVGASEENIRKLFEAAEKEQKEKGDDSHLHVIIFDEIDAICKQRGSNRGSTGVHDTVVNQLLSKLDGVDQLNNILVIGMTNRKDMIDEALLRPGRFEVHMPIGLPDHQGRIQIFKIKTKAMDQSGRLNKESIDWDILSNLSKNMSGAEIEGVVNHAISLAMEPALDTTSGFTFNEEIQKNLQVEMKHLQLAIKMNPPSYGINEHSLLNYIPVHYISYSQHLMNLTQDIHENILKLISSKHLQILSICLDGIHGTGKTSFVSTNCFTNYFNTIY